MFVPVGFFYDVGDWEGVVRDSNLVFVARVFVSVDPRFGGCFDEVYDLSVVERTGIGGRLFDVYVSDLAYESPFLLKVWDEFARLLR